jgi:predicted helicase
VKPDKKHNWVGLSENDWDAFPPVAAKATKAARNPGQVRAIFQTYALGMNTARDEWVYSMDKADLAAKAKALVAGYDVVRPDETVYPDTIKWSRNLKRRLAQGRREKFDAGLIRRANYRPFVPRWLYQSSLFIDEAGGLDSLFPKRPEHALHR